LRPNLATEEICVSAPPPLLLSPAVAQDKSLFNRTAQRTVSTFSGFFEEMFEQHPAARDEVLVLKFKAATGRVTQFANFARRPPDATWLLLCYYYDHHYSSAHHQGKSYIKAASASKRRLNFPAVA
jgi:hypothetical protein